MPAAPRRRAGGGRSPAALRATVHRVRPSLPLRPDVWQLLLQVRSRPHAALSAARIALLLVWKPQHGESVTACYVTAHYVACYGMLCDVVNALRPTSPLERALRRFQVFSHLTSHETGKAGYVTSRYVGFRSSRTSLPTRRARPATLHPVTSVSGLLAPHFPRDGQGRLRQHRPAVAV